MNRIFVIEDEERIKAELITFLNHYGYECISTDNYPNIVEEILSETIDLILLDINLPYFDGYYICREIRKQSDVPIIIVTSRDSEVDELMSLNLGADDFITKPYNTQILLAHIGSVLKRNSRFAVNTEITYKELTLNTSRCVIYYKNGREEELSKNEMRILKLLMENKDNIMSRDEIMNELWQSNEFVDDNTLTVNINRLRKKLEAAGAQNYIITKRGMGYMV